MSAFSWTRWRPQKEGVQSGGSKADTVDVGDRTNDDDDVCEDGSDEIG
jgi:hypothetical protein